MEGAKRPGDDPPSSASLMATTASSSETKTNPNTHSYSTSNSLNTLTNPSSSTHDPSHQPIPTPQQPPKILFQPQPTHSQPQPQPQPQPQTQPTPVVAERTLTASSFQTTATTPVSASAMSTSPPTPSLASSSSSMQTPALALSQPTPTSSMATAPPQPTSAMATAPVTSTTPNPISTSPVTLTQSYIPTSSMASARSTLQTTAPGVASSGAKDANAGANKVAPVVDEATADSKQRMVELGLTEADIKMARERLDSIVKGVDSSASLDPEVEEILIRLSLRFLERTTNAACQLAIHRGSNEVELGDLRLYIEKTLGIKVPGFGLSDCSNISPSLLDNTRETGHPAKPSDTHLRRLHLKRKAHALVPEE